MLNAVNLNLVAFDVWLSRTAEEKLHSGQALTLFTIAIAAAEIGIGLAIVLAVYRGRGTSDIDKLRDTAEGHETDGPDGNNGTDGNNGPGGTHGADGTHGSDNPGAPDDNGTEPPAAEKAEATA
jgi:NADH-quinone oxidoreductase subunit K